MPPPDNGLDPLEREVDPLLIEVAAAVAKIDWDLRAEDVVATASSHRARTVRRKRLGAVLVAAAVIAIFVAPIPQLHLFSSGHTGTAVGHGGSTSTTGPTRKVSKGTTGVSVAEMVAGRWSTMSPAPITARADAAVVWTGRELIVWGGSAGAHGAQLHGDGAAYDPSTNSWRVLPPAPLPPTADASAVWTGSEMVVFGGYDNESLGAFHVTNAVAAYDPSTNRWRRLPPAPLSPRAGAIALWTGKSVIVLGGKPAVTTASLHSPGDGAAFNPTTDTWQHIAAPTPPQGHRLGWRTVVQAGNELLAFSLWSESGSLGHGTYEESGGADLFAYDLTTASWTLVPARPGALPAPEDALWTGRLLVVRGTRDSCGNCPGPAQLSGGEVTALYDPSDNTWTPISPDPLAMADNLTSAWTGKALFSFDPGSQSGAILPGSASLYDPSTGRWSLLPSAPFGCGQPVWTGHQILMYCPQFGSHVTGPAGLVYTPRRSATAVEIRLVLDRTYVKAGTPIRGEALLTNTTGNTITVKACAADGWLSVGLTNDQIGYSPPNPLILCRPTVRLSPGLTRFAITVSTDFQACTQARSQATPELPACTSQPRLPPLPTGRYVTKVVIAGLPAGTRLPPAIKVTLLAP